MLFKCRGESIEARQVCATAPRHGLRGPHDAVNQLTTWIFDVGIIRGPHLIELYKEQSLAHDTHKRCIESQKALGVERFFRFVDKVVEVVGGGYHKVENTVSQEASHKWCERVPPGKDVVSGPHG